MSDETNPMFWSDDNPYDEYGRLAPPGDELKIEAGGLYFDPPKGGWCNSVDAEIMLIESGSEIFRITREGDIVADGKVITHDHAAILDCLRRWAAAHRESVDERRNER